MGDKTRVSERSAGACEEGGWEDGGGKGRGRGGVGAEN